MHEEGSLPSCCPPGFWVGRLSGLKWEKKFQKIRMGGRETHLIVKPMIFKVKDMEEPGWKGEGRGAHRKKASVEAG